MNTGETSGDKFEGNEMSRGVTISITKDIITIIIVTTGSSTTNLKIIKQVRLGNKRERTPRSLCCKSHPTSSLQNSVTASSNNSTGQ